MWSSLVDHVGDALYVLGGHPRESSTVSVSYSSSSASTSPSPGRGQEHLPVLVRVGVHREPVLVTERFVMPISEPRRCPDGTA
ncbi:hypothetical protein C8039_06980 [Halogeometricum sp. wsp3]|nr:hypothetical protein C8039_06980 [Halogeometricum sp. wsp3]